MARRIAHSGHFKTLFPFKITMGSGSLFLVVATLAFTSVSCFPLLDDDSWDHFVFAQFWPQSQCYPMSEEGQPLVGFVANGSCVPNGVKKWTIHGLWPTVLDEEPKPGYCNNSWPFDVAQVEDLKTRLLIQWPSYEAPANPESFWKHEWEKHGTCATSLDSMDSEHKFFSIGLALNTQFDLYGVLAQGGIVPSDSTSYKVNDIESAMTKAFGVKSRVCCQDVKGKHQVLSYIELCLDKSLKSMDCHITTAKCNYTQSVQYPPIITKDIEV